MHVAREFTDAEFGVVAHARTIPVASSRSMSALHLKSHVIQVLSMLVLVKLHNSQLKQTQQTHVQAINGIVAHNLSLTTIV
jgi:hypothetical protein